MEGAGAAQSPASFSSAVSPVVAFSAFLEACGNKPTVAVRTGARLGTVHSHSAGSRYEAAHPRRLEAPSHKAATSRARGTPEYTLRWDERQAQNVTTQDLGNIWALPIARDNVPQILTKRGQITFFFFFFWVFRLAELCRRACREEGNISS